MLWVLAALYRIGRDSFWCKHERENQRRIPAPLAYDKLGHSFGLLTTTSYHQLPTRHFPHRNICMLHRGEQRMKTWTARRISQQPKTLSFFVQVKERGEAKGKGISFAITPTKDHHSREESEPFVRSSSGWCTRGSSRTKMPSIGVKVSDDGHQEYH